MWLVTSSRSFHTDDDMGIARRPGSEPVGDDAWRRRHRAQLIRWLPAEVVASQRALNYVLLHGEDHLGTRWTPDWLDPVEAAAFLAFLETQFIAQDGYEIFGKLRQRAKV